MLPTPANPQPLTANPFGAFSGSPFGGGPSQAKPLFGSSSGIKRPAQDEAMEEEKDTKHTRLEETVDEEDNGANEKNARDEGEEEE